MGFSFKKVAKAVATGGLSLIPDLGKGLMDSLSPGSDSNLAGQMNLDLSAEQAMLNDFKQYYESQSEKSYLWQQQQYASNKADIDQLNAAFGDELASQIAHSNTIRQQYLGKYLQAEDKSFNDAMNYDTPYRRETEAARAVAETSKVFEQQKRQAISDLASYGIQPDDRQALDREITIAKATESVNQANQARRFVEEQGRTMVNQQVQLGMAKDQASSQLLGQAINTGNAVNVNQAQLGIQNTQQAAGALGNVLGYDQMKSAIPTDLANMKIEPEKMRMGLITEDYSNKVRAKESRNATITSTLLGGAKMLAGI